MSQFMLCKTSRNLVEQGCVKISDSKLNKEFLAKAAKEVFACDTLHDIWEVSNIDDLIIQCQRQIVDHSFEITELYSLLSSLFDLSDTLALWYSDEYQDLDYVYSKEQFLGSVKESVMDSMCECYLYAICPQLNHRAIPQSGVQA